MTDDRTPTHCPHCGHDGAVDGHGNFIKQYKRTRAGVTSEVEQRWQAFHCPECDEEFALLADADKETVDGGSAIAEVYDAEM